MKCQKLIPAHPAFQHTHRYTECGQPATTRVSFRDGKSWRGFTVCPEHVGDYAHPGWKREELS